VSTALIVFSFVGWNLWTGAATYWLHLWVGPVLPPSGYIHGFNLCCSGCI